MASPSCAGSEMWGRKGGEVVAGNLCRGEVIHAETDLLNVIVRCNKSIDIRKSDTI